MFARYDFIKKIKKGYLLQPKSNFCKLFCIYSTALRRLVLVNDY